MMSGSGRGYNEKCHKLNNYQVESNNSYFKTGVESYASSQHTRTPNWVIIHMFSFTMFLADPFSRSHSLGAARRLFSPLLFVGQRLGNIQAQAIRVQVHLVLALLQDLSNVLRVLELPQVNIGPRLLDGVTNELGGSCLTLGADDCSLLFLAGLVDDEGGSLSLLLCDLLGFNSGGELGREGQMLDNVSTWYVSDVPCGPYRQRHIV
jgi:hypothetical protein